MKTRLVMADLAADCLLTALEDRRRRPCLIRRPTFDRPAYGVTTEDHAGEPDGRGGQQAGRDQADGGARAGTGPLGTKILARSRRADRRRRRGRLWPGRWRRRVSDRVASPRARPGRRRGGVRHQTVPAERGAGRGEQCLIRSNASRSLVPLAPWRAAAPWPRTDRHSLMILIDTGAPSRREAVRTTNESQRNQPSSDPARPTQKLLASKGSPFDSVRR